MKLKYLFDPITINGMTLKNRIIMPAIHHHYTPDGNCTERFTHYYRERAEGGAGLLIVGGCSFDPYGRGNGMMSLAADELIPGWKAFTDEIHRLDCKVAVQLYHAGRYAKQKNLPEGELARAPSAVYASYTHETPRSMTVEEIGQTIRDWAEGARRAKEAGFDAVELSASAGYLICQFLSPLTNRRSDEYGGDWDNRCRFARELVAAVRVAVGADYPLLMRMAGHDFVQGSNTLEDAVRFAAEMEKAGVDLLDVTGGWHESAIPQITGDLPAGGYSYLAGAIHAAVSIPVAASNRMGDPAVAELVLALGRADLVCLGRPLVADPEWPEKARTGRAGEIRPCMACNQGCLAKTFFGKPVECLVNGRAGREYLYPPRKAAHAEDILVVGGGPAGCEFAIRAAELGHRVTLWEKEHRLGGQLGVVAAPPGKQEFARLVLYYEAVLKKLDVQVETDREATVENVLTAGFTMVVIATGSVPKTLPLPERQGAAPAVVTAHDVLSGRVMAGKRVVILGGGSVGCETAEFLARQGSLSPEEFYFLSAHKAEPPEVLERLLNASGREITLVEITGKFGANFDPGTGWPVMAELKRLGVKRLGYTTLERFGEGRVILTQNKPDEPGQAHTLACDTLVLAVGSATECGLYRALEGKIPHLYALGDAVNTGKILDAVRDACDLAYKLDSRL